MTYPLTLTVEDGMARLKTTYEIDNDGRVTLDVLIPNDDHTILTLQAIACEFAAAALSRRAQNFRSLIPKSQPSE